MKNIIKKWYYELGFPTEWDNDFEELLAKIGDRLVPCLLEEYDLNPLDRQVNLLMFLYFLDEAKRRYDEMGIPYEIFKDSFSDIIRWTKTNYQINGCLGICEADWVMLPYKMEIFKLGRLQFAMKPGILDIHIPAGEPLTPEKVDASIAMAREFFPKYYPDFKFEKFSCHSWLLDETLDQLLPEGSNITAFRKRFDIKEGHEDTYAALRYTFKWNIKFEELADFPARPGYPEKLKNYVLGGGKLYDVLGEFY